MEAGVIKTAQLFGFQWPPVTPEQILGDRGWPVFPGGYLVGTLLLLNLLTAHYARFELSAKKAGIFLTHIGIITLLLGQLFTDILQVESFVSMERGDRRNYSISFDDNELVFMHPMKGGSNRVVSIPEQMLKNKTSTEHPELKELKIETERYWVNAKPMTADQLIDLDGEMQKELRNKVLEQVYGLINTRITRMEEYLRENTNAERRKELTGLKAIFILTYSFKRSRY